MTKEEFKKLKNGDEIVCLIDIAYIAHGIPKTFPTKGIKGVVVGKVVVGGDHKESVLVNLTVDNSKKADQLFSFEHYAIERLKNKRSKDNQQEILKVIRSGKATVVIMKDDQGRYIKGVAKCCPEDEYDSIYGLSLAYERAIRKKAKKKEQDFKETFGTKNKCG